MAEEPLGEKADAGKAEAAKPAETCCRPPKRRSPSPRLLSRRRPEEPTFFEELMDNPAMLAGGVGVLAPLAGLVAVGVAAAAGGETPLTILRPPVCRRPASARTRFSATPVARVSIPRTRRRRPISARPVRAPSTPMKWIRSQRLMYIWPMVAMYRPRKFLLEAKSKDPKRYAIHLKLLEIYANRQNSKAVRDAGNRVVYRNRRRAPIGKKGSCDGSEA